METHLVPRGDEEAVGVPREAEVGDPVLRRVRQLPAHPDAAAAATIDRRLAGGGCAHGGVEGVEEEAARRWRARSWLGLGCCVSR